jgi:tetratricopeptide (TPR) repeat protein
VAHGCQAGLQQEVCDRVFYTRISRAQEAYAAKKLGAFASDLGAIACFFDSPWSRVSSAIREADQAWVLNEAAFRLRALGRLNEALEPMRVSGEMHAKLRSWKNSAISYSNLSGLQLVLGEVAEAVRGAEKSVTYADNSGDSHAQYTKRTTLADALHQAGRRREAGARFREGELLQAKHHPDHPLLFSMWGFWYCDLLLSDPERIAWQFTLHSLFITDPSSLSASCRAVAQRAAQALRFATAANLLLDVALDRLTLGRAALYESILEKTEIRIPSGSTVETDGGKSEINQAMDGLRRAGAQEFIVRGLLTRAWRRSITAPRTGPESAQSDLDEAWGIAERGPMPLFLADIHLHRARLFGVPKDEGRRAKYPWESVQIDLAEARRLIEKHGYWRRKEELEDAEAALIAN